MRTIFFVTLIAAVSIAAIASVAQNPFDANRNCPIYDSSGQQVAVGDGSYVVCQDDRGLNLWTGSDEISMVQIGTLVAPMYNAMGGGDSDEDGLFEAYMYIKDNPGGTWTYTYRIYENDGFNNYPQAFQAEAGMIPYAYGDQDGDGLPEVIGQWSYWVYVYESPAAGYLATRMVWQSPQMYNVTGYTTMGDLDQDGLGEIIHTQNGFGSDNRLVIFECTGNNQFQQIYNQQVSSNNLGSKAVADFDGDGLWEVAFTSGGGDVYVFESRGNNALAMTYHGNMGTYNAYACCYADDMDGNGRPEFICGGSDSGQGWITQIYEADGNDSYVVRQEIVVWDGYFGIPGNAAGDLDGDGIDEFVIQIAQALHLYKWNGYEYASEGVIPENFGSIQHGIFCYDGNDNGFDELFWLGIGDGGYWTNETINLEYEFAGAPPNITVTMTPDTLPVIIPSLGGSFNFNIEVANHESDSVTFDTWIMVQLPDSSWHGPVLGPMELTLSGGQTLDRDRTQFVPERAPAGTYTYEARVGSYPDIVWDSDSFEFDKLGTGDCEAISNWANTGEELRPVSSGFEYKMPSDFLMVQIYPNPFNATTTIGFELRDESFVRLEVFDINGRLVGSRHASPLLDGFLEDGTYQVTFDGSDLSSGIYIYRLQAGKFTTSGKMVLIK